jgi:hypothetical protein
MRLSSLFGLIGWLTISAAVSHAQDLQYQHISAKRSKKIGDCQITEKVTTLRVGSNGTKVFLPRSQNRKGYKLAQRARFFACGVSTTNPAQFSLFTKTSRDGAVTEIPLSLDLFPKLKSSSGSLGSVCSRVQGLPGAFIYKTIGSHHFTDIRRNTIGLIARPGVNMFWPSCVGVLDSSGEKIGSLALYDTGDGWSARYYAGIGCASSEPYNGNAMADRARRNTRSEDIYFDFGSTCYGPVEADECVRSTSC